MGSCFSTVDETTLQPQDRSVLLVAGYFRIHISSLNYAPVDIVCLCSNYLKSNILNEFNDGDKVIIQHYGADPDTEAFITPKLYNNPEFFYTISGISGKSWNIVKMNPNDPDSVNSVAFAKDDTWLNAEIYNDGNLSLWTGDWFNIQHVFSRNITLELQSLPNNYLRVQDNEFVLTTFDGIDKQCEFTIWPAFSRFRLPPFDPYRTDVKERIVIIKSAYHANKERYLRVNPSDMDNVDLNGDKGECSRWEVTVDWKNETKLRNVYSGKYLNVRGGDDNYMLNATGVIDDGIDFKLDKSFHREDYRINVTLRALIPGDPYLHLKESGDIEIAVDGQYAELMMFQLGEEH